MCNNIYAFRGVGSQLKGGIRWCTARSLHYSHIRGHFIITNPRQIQVLGPILLLSTISHNSGAFARLYLYLVSKLIFARPYCCSFVCPPVLFGMANKGFSRGDIRALLEEV